MINVRDIPPFGLRMPMELRETLKERAWQNRRSLNSEIVMILEKATRETETKKPEIPA